MGPIWIEFEQLGWALIKSKAQSFSFLLFLHTPKILFLAPLDFFDRVNSFDPWSSIFFFLHFFILSHLGFISFSSSVCFFFFFSHLLAAFFPAATVCSPILYFHFFLCCLQRRQWVKGDPATGLGSSDDGGGSILAGHVRCGRDGVVVGMLTGWVHRGDGATDLARRRGQWMVQQGKRPWDRRWQLFFFFSTLPVPFFLADFFFLFSDAPFSLSLLFLFFSPERGGLR
jgi:hypothetical protein